MIREATRIPVSVLVACAVTIAGTALWPGVADAAKGKGAKSKKGARKPAKPDATPPADESTETPGVDAAEAPAGPHACSKEEALELYEAGQTHYKRGEYSEAVIYYASVYRCRGSAAMLFNIAQAYRLMGDCGRALKYYESYLKVRPDAPNREAVERWFELCFTAVKEGRSRPYEVEEADGILAGSAPPRKPKRSTTGLADIEVVAPDMKPTTDTPAKTPAVTVEETPTAPKKRSRAPLIVGISIAVVGVTAGLTVSGILLFAVGAKYSAATPDAVFEGF